jgi:hypothetical protein
MSDPVPSNGSLICTFADCLDRDIGVCGTYCNAWKRAGYSGTHLTCEDIVSGNVERDVTGKPYFKCPRGFKR